MAAQLGRAAPAAAPLARCASFGRAPSRALGARRLCPRLVFAPHHQPAARAAPVALASGALAAAAGQRRQQRLSARRSAEALEASWHEPYGPPVVLEEPTEEPLRFEVGDRAAVEHLSENGYVVFGGALREEEAEHATDLFWRYVELKTRGEILRGQPETWGSHLWPAQPHNGIINCGGIGQSAFMWYVRSRPRVLRAFAGIWGLDGPEDLLVSFDGGCAFRPPGLDPSWRTRSGWFHTDQNGMTTGSDFACVQGLVSLTRSDASTGGFAAVPGSHRQHESVFRRWPLERENDFFVLPRSDPLLSRGAPRRPRLVPTRPGDLLLWDSRCVHCNLPARHRFDAAPLSEAMASAGLASSSEPVLRELTSVADAAWIATSEGAQRTRALLAEWGVAESCVEPVAEQFGRWASELARDLAGAGTADLSRLVAYVCACPRSHVDEHVRRVKRSAAILGATTTHWPDRMVVIDTALGEPYLADLASLDGLALRVLGCEGDTREAALSELAADTRTMASRAAPEHRGALTELASRLEGG